MQFSDIASLIPVLLMGQTAISAALIPGIGAPQPPVTGFGADAKLAQRSDLRARSLDPNDPNNNVALFLYSESDCLTPRMYYTLENWTRVEDGDCIQLNTFPGPSWDVYAVGVHYLRGTCTSK